MPQIYQNGIEASTEKHTNLAVSVFYQNGNVLPMPKNNLETLRKRAGLTREELAELVGTTETTIYRKERGIRGLQEDELDLYAQALHCRPEELVSVALYEVPVVGTISAGGRVTIFDDLPLIKNGKASESGDFVKCDFVNAPSGVHPAEARALTLADDAMEPFLANDSIFYYKTQASEHIPDLIGKRCIVKLKDGSVLYRVLKRGHSLGKYNLSFFNSKDMEDIELEWCTEIINIKPA